MERRQGSGSARVDQDLHAVILAEALADEGVEAFHAERGCLEAFDRAGGRFDLVVTDLQMPHMDGTELIEQLRARVPALPIIVLTAHTMDASDDWLAMTRADCCVSKPLSIAELVAALDSLGLSRGPREPPRAGEVAWGPITTRQRERLPGLTSRGLARPRAR
ncbi:MAG: response regulator [Deltaproteobacteria bacterium]|nr:response regulator [Deltaproteobacteria bacterium]